MIQRKTYEKIPLQGNVYPMASMAYIEDQSFRLTILSGQPSGIACFKSGKRSMNNRKIFFCRSQKGTIDLFPRSTTSTRR